MPISSLPTTTPPLASSITDAPRLPHRLHSASLLLPLLQIHHRDIIDILGRIRPDDVGLRDDFRFSHGMNTAGHRNPPIITCKSIIRCKNFEIAVLFLPKGTVMPLHDHPGMTVFSKLLIGSAHVEGYDWIRRPRTFSTISGSRILAEKVLDRDVTPESGARVLFPDAGGNMHRFVAGEEMHCAFLDVLTPPYAPTERRRCTYHKDFPCNLCACWRTSGLTEAQRRPGKLAWLQEVAKPRDLRIISLQYRKLIIF
ncbi:plant cysteine oxidase 2 [Setaria italica]|nr:plant cysteine oxidase 2 [Setaria italica]